MRRNDAPFNNRSLYEQSQIFTTKNTKLQKTQKGEERMAGERLDLNEGVHRRGAERAEKTAGGIT
jgi:hypothetical protein